MPTRPNILFISDDQHRYDYLDLWERFPVRTPNISRLAKEGVWHRAAYSTCPLCMPARCSMITGLYGHQTGLTTNIGHWPFGLRTMPQALQDGGYHTAAIGKLHVFEGVPERLDLTTVEQQVRSLGFDDLHEVSGKALALHLDCAWTHDLKAKGLLEIYREDATARGVDPQREAKPSPLAAAGYIDTFIGNHAVEWLEQYRDEKPFFLWAGFCGPHLPFDAPAEFFSLHAPDAQVAPLDNPHPEHWALRRAHYTAMIELVDQQVGRLLETLERRGMLDNTLIFFVADHGEMLGDHGMSGKCHPHDPSSRVPLLARYPALIAPGTVSDALVEITDLTATCLHVASGCAHASDLLPASQARSLLPHWHDPARPHREFIYSEDGGQFLPPYQMIRTTRWKYSLYVRDGRELLFDMLADPDECHNLADDPAYLATKDSLKTTLLCHIANTPPPLPRDVHEHRAMAKTSA